tara:strand:- start:28068 stop:28331 length:264 start_codon:yes stop_codon:yes gene_type:complete
MGNPQEEATELKNKGNEAFKNHDFPTALDFYTKAIELHDKDPSFYTNRAQVGSRAAARDRRLTDAPGTHQARIIRLCSRGCGQGDPA